MCGTAHMCSYSIANTVRDLDQMSLCTHRFEVTRFFSFPMSVAISASQILSFTQGWHLERFQYCTLGPWIQDENSTCFRNHVLFWSVTECAVWLKRLVSKPLIRTWVVLLRCIQSLDVSQAQMHSMSVLEVCMTGQALWDLDQDCHVQAHVDSISCLLMCGQLQWWWRAKCNLVTKDGLEQSLRRVKQPLMVQLSSLFESEWEKLQRIAIRLHHVFVLLSDFISVVKLYWLHCGRWVQHDVDNIHWCCQPWWSSTSHTQSQKQVSCVAKLLACMTA